MSGKFEVEFWPDVKVEVEISDGDLKYLSPGEVRSVALCHAFEKHGWPGDCECTANGWEFRAWVRRKEEPDDNGGDRQT